MPAGGGDQRHAVDIQTDVTHCPAAVAVIAAAVVMANCPAAAVAAAAAVVLFYRFAGGTANITGRLIAAVLPAAQGG